MILIIYWNTIAAARSTATLRHSRSLMAQGRPWTGVGEKVVWLAGWLRPSPTVCHHVTGLFWPLTGPAGQLWPAAMTRSSGHSALEVIDLQPANSAKAEILKSGTASQARTPASKGRMDYALVEYPCD